MDNGFEKINIIIIALSGLLLFLTGLALYLFKDAVARNIRYFLPIPPIGVAAYVFVYNVFRHTGGSLPGSWPVTLIELLYGTLISALVFFLFSATILITAYFLKTLLP